MPVSVTMPRLGESVTEGTVTRWLKQEGERVEADEPLLEVSTDKVDTEIPSPAAGVLTRIVVGEDETAEVGSELAVIAGEGEDTGSAAPAPAQQAAAEPEPAAPVTPSTEKPVEAEAPAPQAAAPAGNAQGTEIKLPALGESVTEGTVTRWLKQVGEEVEADEPLVEVSTDKVDTEIPSPVAGTLLEIRVGEDETANVGAVLAVIGTPGSAPAAAPAPAPAPAPAQAPAPKVESAPAPKIESAPAPQVAPEPVKAPAPAAVESNGAGDAGYVTPLVRKLAAEKGVDLSTLTGTGVGGRIRKQDVIDAAAKAAAAKAAPAPAAQAERAAAPVEKAAAKAEPSPLRGRTEKLTRIRATIARRMVESLQVSAQLTTVVEVDVTKIANLRNKAKADFQAKHGVKLTFLPFFALATVEALQQHPVVNSSIDVEAGTVTYHGAEHLGIAVDAPKGLVVPVIKDAGDLNLGGLAKRISDVAERTRNNKIGPDELGGGTFTLTNTGSRGALFDTPIINQPQVGILGLGAVVKRPVIVNDPDLGEIIAPRSMVYLALSYDHRIVDGADAARFLGTLKERLEGGHFEADLGL
ncbi:dihydrolipoamide acetyltransferase component of pyruvate dehydrogenase complex [Actinoplanes lobatus]|uniref:Dihydrolipoamide acetyltransferase component of pyruvate dehydrogenase complex n=1 Tax=Actinoplanes lobatus TaxID=113568 RepID=A0A7W7HF12_9ACTN|nr:2-oxoglutarate dehydrogenase, E2 component, dihydrolipoamide succinyltransferase [Actinoplanes lobatus]MBB4749335.1 2-oxoglutarate dehydrogenase E2 component (dihydrolipoamide succinyltransferase) [Actinoplanes lobatus]GGN79630.1 dihydrolipoamide acetyltransferase component of pyruvate dehydrogenase complex [Actinoplanes lobatus]GIE40274.1 dihydrolipoamide acetyltransferase component of pyruvate dehydrogenase complex [Actinoplanes lobatus]